MRARSAIKEKVTISLDPELVDAVDSEVRSHAADSRSAVVEEALRLWQIEHERHAIERGVEEYYRSRNPREQREDRAWSRLAGRHAKRLWDD